MKAALVTGAARRIGAAIARTLHERGYHVVLHCRKSVRDAQALAAELNAVREDSARCIQADLTVTGAAAELAAEAIACWDGLHVLVNNASDFYPSPLGHIRDEDWDKLAGSNLKAPIMLCQATAPALRAAKGAVVNLSDIHAQKGLHKHLVYCAAKGGLEAFTRALALDLAPEVRVNCVAPGAILPPAEAGEGAQAVQPEDIPLGRWGLPEEIAQAVAFLAGNAPYMTGQILPVDGGRHLRG